MSYLKKINDDLLQTFDKDQKVYLIFYVHIRFGVVAYTATGFFYRTRWISCIFNILLNFYLTLTHTMNRYLVQNLNGV